MKLGLPMWLGAVALLCLTSWGAAAQDAAPEPWTESVRNAAAQDPALETLAPSDINRFCPNYAGLDAGGRQAFWSNLLVEIARAESGGDAGRTRWLVFDPAMHRPAFRRGLFQISIEAARCDRFNCAVTSAADLTNPGRNAACAVRIFEDTVGAKGAIAGAGDYWPSLARATRRAHIAAATSSAGSCATGVSRP